jgi:hypothetical protein
MLLYAKTTKFMNYMQILSNPIKIQSLIAPGFVCATQSGAIKDRILIRLNKLTVEILIILIGLCLYKGA